LRPACFVLSFHLLFTAAGIAADKDARKGGGGWEFTSGFEKPVVRKESYGMLPVEFSVAYYVGDQDQRYYGLTRNRSHLGRQCMYLDLGNNGGPAGFGATGVIKEFPLEKLVAGTRFEVEAWFASDPDHPMSGGTVNVRLEFFGPTAATQIYNTADDESHAHATLRSVDARPEFDRFFLDYVVAESTIPDPSIVRLVKLVVGGDSDGNSGKGRALVDDVRLVVTPPAAGM
jgi:hypothetical protein